MRDMLDGARTAACFMSKGSNTKISRWFSWLDCVLKLLKSWHYFLLVLCFLLRSDGTIKRLDDLDRSQQNIDDGVAATRALAKAKAIAVDVKKTVKHGNVEVDALRATCKDTRHLTAKIMSNPITFRIAQITVCVCQAVRDQHAVHTEMMHTKRGSFEFSTSMARGSYERVLSDTCGFSPSRACLLQCGLEVPPPQDKAVANDVDWDAFPHRDDNDMAKLMLTFVLQECCLRGLTALAYTPGLAKVCFGLFDHAPGKSAGTLKPLQPVCESFVCAASLKHLDSAGVLQHISRMA